MRRTLCLLLATLFGACPSSADFDRSANSGNAWLKLCKAPPDSPANSGCFFLVVGMLAESYMYPREKRAFCIPDDVTTNQIFAIVLQKIEADPEHWHYPFHVLVHTALERQYPCQPPQTPVGPPPN